ncbi:urease accessory protein [Pseudonocardia thermophila]|uniref:Urease accessory protein UreD n=1 Tax=Pseudonocardia thermophila TaxID=1848 RepID=A0A1M6N6W3_PSETH|nr:urease accessory protein UreD [Pseudonocardia thermophila]SHJ91475.1 urease accessory protein [Pseudonocardia thermophila]
MRYGVSAAASVQVLPGERQRIRWSQAWPILLRPTGDDRVHLVQGAGGPLGGDELSLTLDVGAGARLDLRSAAATVVQPGADGGCARWSVTAAVAGCLHWAPEPSIVTDGAELDSRLRIDVARGGSAVVVETAVLGRHGQRGGRYRGELVATWAGRPLLTHVTQLDGADPVLSGPGGSAGARAVGSVLVVGRAGGSGAGELPGVRWAWSPLAGPGAVLLAVGDPGAVSAVLHEQLVGLTNAAVPAATR